MHCEQGDVVGALPVGSGRPDDGVDECVQVAALGPGQMAVRAAIEHEPWGERNLGRGRRVSGPATVGTPSPTRGRHVTRDVFAAPTRRTRPGDPRA
ncbi:hypothetical protein SRB17_24900 [Streptomyces sp. RB17]|nr:hypothetical protein [Streptomyces sp. RB17]